MSSRMGRTVSRYEAMLRLRAAGRLSEQEIERRVCHYARSAADQQMVVVATRAILCRHAIPSWVFPMYHAYSRELGRLKRQGVSAEARGESLRATAGKWLARGLDGAALKDVAENLYNLPWPESPGDNHP
jgi:hypothetical protein